VCVREGELVNGKNVTEISLSDGATFMSFGAVLRELQPVWGNQAKAILIT
jgi:hypothetical protein